MDYVIFTDGSSRGNPGPGGWGTLVVRQDGGKVLNEEDTKKEVMEMGGGIKSTTNNRMELTAALRGLEKIPVGGSVTVYTDSSYLINGITKWIAGWKRNGWQTKTKQDVLNKDIWQDLDMVIGGKTVVWKYVGGHIGVTGNERCDVIATSFADGTDISLYKGSLVRYPIKNILSISHDTKKVVEKSAKDSRSSARAYSYISLVNRDVKIHKTWAECEERVRGARGARYRKALDPEEQERIVLEFRNL